MPRENLHFCLQRQAHLGGKEHHYHAKRPLLAAWEAKSALKGAKSLLCLFKGTELLRRSDILRLQVEQRALEMAGIKCNGPLMENHLIAAGQFLSCGATQSSRSEHGTDHYCPGELLVLVTHCSLWEHYSKHVMGRQIPPPTLFSENIHNPAFAFAG